LQAVLRGCHKRLRELNGPLDGFDVSTPKNCIDVSTPKNCIKEPNASGGGELRRIELSECRGALDHGNLGPPHARELKLCLRDSAGALEHDFILGVADDFVDELVQLFRKCRG
jgi:hypothetical protein